MTKTEETIAVHGALPPWSKPGIQAPMQLPSPAMEPVSSVAACFPRLGACCLLVPPCVALYRLFFSACPRFGHPTSRIIPTAFCHRLSLSNRRSAGAGYVAYAAKCRLFPQPDQPPLPSPNFQKFHEYLGPAYLGFPHKIQQGSRRICCQERADVVLIQGQKMLVKVQPP